MTEILQRPKTSGRERMRQAISAQLSGMDPINLRGPTLGGSQFWRDVRIHAGWRVQENVYTSHCRLLDPSDTRHAWGEEEVVQARFEALKKAYSLSPASPHLVLMAHGIAPMRTTFTKMKRRLLSEGYDAIDVRYPSTRDTIEAHADGLAQLLSRLEGTTRVSFVTHSMGGLVVRSLLARHRPLQDKIALGKVMMIAPPNQGSAIAGVLKSSPLYRAVLGGAGQQLAPDRTAELPEPPLPFAVIAGGSGSPYGFNPLLGEDNDGVVSVAETKLPGEEARHLVRAIHNRISSHPETIEKTLAYLAA